MMIQFDSVCLTIHILFICVYLLSQTQSIPTDWKSSTNLSANGLQFSPVNQQAQFLLQITTKSIISCAAACHSNAQCGIFDYDSQSRRCRLFQGDVVTMGSLVTSSFSQSRVGSIKLQPTQFVNYGQACSNCRNNRYLMCVNSTCQCHALMFFDLLICQSQKLMGSQCNSNAECRTDLNYTCLARQQCNLASTETGLVVGGYGNGTAGNATDALSQPGGLAAGIDNSLYVSDYSNNRVIKLSSGSLFGSIVAGTGVAGSAANQLNGPAGLYVDTSLNIYVADSNNYRIMFWAKNASVGIKVAGTGSYGNTMSSFSLPIDLFVDQKGNIYVSDTINHRIMKFTPNVTNATIVAGTGVSGNNTNQLNTPYGIYYDEMNSYLYVSDSGNNRIQRYVVNISTNGLTVAGGNGTGAGNNQLNSPYSVSVSKLTNAMYIADSGNNRVQCWNAGATSGVTIAGSGASSNNYSTVLQGSMNVKLSMNETYLFVAEMSYNTVWRFALN